jgi:hypothetical protein
MRIATFNLQNMRLRADHLEGARDADMPKDQQQQSQALDHQDRRLSAQVIRDTQADIIALQEVFDLPSLEAFHDRFLVPSGSSYPHRICLPGNDGRGLDVAALSCLTPNDIQSHAQETAHSLGLSLPDLPPDQPIFRRDVLRLTFGALTLYICHFKAPYPDTPRTWAIRHAEALALRKIIQRDHPDRYAQALWLVLGDLNEPQNGPHALPPLLQISVDLMQRVPKSQRWSWHHPPTHLYGIPDAMLASPALAQRFPKAQPNILREGMSRETHRYAGPHLPDVGHHRPHASDHAAVVIDFPGL